MKTVLCFIPCTRIRLGISKNDFCLKKRDKVPVCEFHGSRSGTITSHNKGRTQLDFILADNRFIYLSDINNGLW